MSIPGLTPPVVGVTSAAAASTAPVIIGTASNWSSGSSASVAKPTGAVSTDYLIAFLGVAEPDGGSDAPGAQSGWTTLVNEGMSQGNSGFAYGAFWRLCGSGSSFSFTVDGTDFVAAIIAVRSTHGTPVYTSASAESTSSSSSIQAPSVTSTAADHLLITGHILDESESITPPSGMTEQVERDKNGNAPTVSICTLALGAAGATGTKTATASGSDVWGAISVIVR